MRKVVIQILAGTFLLFSCAKKTSPVVPSVSFASDTFKLLKPFVAKEELYNARTQKQYYDVPLNESVTWHLTYEGVNSHAKRDFSGTSKSFSLENTYWDGRTNGTTDDLNIFLRGEKIGVVCSIFGLNKTLKDTFTLNIPVDYGVRVNDFQSGVLPTSGFYSSVLEKPEDTFSYGVDSAGGSPQGGFYMYIKGVDNSRDYYINNLGFNAGQNGNPPMFYFKDRAVFNYKNPPADSMYINMFVKGNGASDKSKLGIQLSESDSLWSVRNPDGSVNYSQDETFVKDVTLNYDGWKLISFKYSEMIEPSYLVSDKRYKNHVTKKEPEKINSFGFLAQTTDNLGSKFEAKIDFIYLTYGKPLLKSNE